MIPSKHLLYRTALIAVLIASSACTTTEVEQWQVVPDTIVDYAYVKPGGDFSSYRRLYPAPFEIYYPEETGDPAPEDVERIRQIFRDAFRNAVGDDYEIVSEPGADVLKVRASLVDLRTNPPVGTVNVGRKLANVVNAGHLTFLMEMIDSRTDEVLARAADEEKPEPRNDGLGGEANWDAVRAAAERWTALFRNFLDENLGRS